MAEFKVSRVDQGHTKIRNVPIAVTPEGFWCCPSPVMFQKVIKAQNLQNKPRSSSPPPKTSVPKKQNSVNERKPAPTSSRSRVVSDDKKHLSSDTASISPSMVSIEFGEPGTSDLKVILSGKQGFSVKMSVHKNVLIENSSFFANKLSLQEPPPSCLQLSDCEDVEVYVETISELIGFQKCIESCLEYLEAVPWIGEEEEEKVVSSVLRVTPVLKRVTSETPYPPNDTLSHIMELVLKSNEERGRREMKSLVLRLLRENNSSLSNGSSDIFNRTIYKSCQSCLDSLLILFESAAEPGFIDKSLHTKGPVMKQIALEADNLLWLLDILADRQAADEFAVLWASQKELATLHSKLPTVSRHLVSCITSRFFVGIGRGEILPSKDTRQLLLQTWLQPLINDYYWLQHSCRSFDRKVVEERIGRTILTLPLEDQQSILLAWLGNFLKAGDNCPNLQ
ncbi:hypothetical protein AQUCO_01000396v1 [Aquilegia coerulea]|uniref:At3g05675-like ankyrin-like domain-containing protein n=1 Tax=Aquilegia coerulea TaxID=218851 RepID=A0A2G5E9R1_AQUCA|nr:hypothetical protein AQUCO_01000396v1 [Aquilegia coerulea]